MADISVNLVIFDQSLAKHSNNMKLWEKARKRLASITQPPPSYYESSSTLKSSSCFINFECVVLLAIIIGRARER